MRLSRVAPEDRDAGTTMAEMVVGMSIMAVFLAMFTGAMFSVYQVSSHTEAVTVTSGQLNTAFTKLDKLVRYAAAISAPSSTPNAAGNYYVEFQTANTGTTTCSQLQLNTNTQKLSQRNWSLNSSGSAYGLSAFIPLASNIQPNGRPFTMVANGVVDDEQLTFALQSSLGTSQTNSDTTITFTALNSNESSTRARTDPTLPNSVCQEVGRP